MQYIEKLNRQRDEALESLDDLVRKIERENRDFNSAERTRRAELTKSVEKLNGDIKAENERLHRPLPGATPRRSSLPWSQPTTQPMPGGGVHTEPRHAPLTAFRGKDGVRNALTFGHQLRAMAFRGDKNFGHLSDESSRWLNDNGAGELRAQSHTYGEGGATVPDSVSDTMIENVEEYGVIRRLCAEGGSLFPMKSDSLQIPRRLTGYSGFWTSDGVPTTESEASFDAPMLVSREYSVMSRIPIALAEDSVVNLGDFVARDMAREIAHNEDDCCINGDGTSTYGGIVGIRHALTGQSLVDAITGDDQFSELTVEDLRKMVRRCAQYAGLRPVWLASHGGGWIDTFQRLASAQNGATSGDLLAGLPKTFLGYPVVTTDLMPNEDSAYDEEVMIVFGDIARACAFGARSDFTLRVSDQRFFEYREIGFLASSRFDFVVHDRGDDSNAGCLIGLRGNTS